MSDSRKKGDELESRIAEFLRTHGYEVSRNQVRQGRSGAQHELDVVAKKHDGLTTFELVVECKAWESPIDKDVVYKLAAELADLGAAKGIIATLSGWTVQAGQAATQANIEMWGPEELSARMGELSMSQLHQGPKQLIAIGAPFEIDSKAAFVHVNRSASGTLGVGKEEVTAYGALWLPTWSLQLGITRNEGFLKKTARATRVWNGYDALAGGCLFNATNSPNFGYVTVGNNAIDPAVKVSDVVKFLNSKITQWRQTTKLDERKARAMSLVKYGIQVPLSNLAIESSTLVYLPLWVAILNKRGEERAVAIDGVTGIPSQKLAGTLTKHVQRVRSAIVQ